MPWRLIIFIAVFGVFLAFITFNLENKCDISFGIKTYKDVPVFLTVFTSFVFGLLCTLPFIFTAGKRRKEKEAKEKAAKEKTMKDRIHEPDEASTRTSESNFNLREKFMRNHSGKPSGGGHNGNK